LGFRVFTPPPVSGKRKPLVKLRNAVKYMISLPPAEQNAEHWRPAATLLAIIGERGGCMFEYEVSRPWIERGKTPPGASVRKGGRAYARCPVKDNARRVSMFADARCSAV
jgi:hypothetical protein